MGGASSLPDDRKRDLASTMGFLFAGVTCVTGLYTVVILSEGRFEAKLDSSVKELKADLDKNYSRLEAKLDSSVKELVAKLDQNDKRFKDALRLQAQATMNPPLAHLMYSDQRSVEDVLRDPKYAPLAR
jgi:hypothetical protein